MKKNRLEVILLSIIGLAFAIRICSVFANLPYMYWHDENNYIDNALCFGAGNFKLITFTHGALYQLILFFEYLAYYVIGRVFSLFHSPLDFYIGYLKDPTGFFIIARVTAVLCGTGAVYLTYLIAKRIYGARVGLAAALFAGFSLLMVQMSSLALADVPSIFILLLSFLALVFSVEKPDDNRIYYAAACLIGLAMACKYYTAFGVIPLYIAAFVKCRSSDDGFRRFLSLTAFGSLFVFIGFCIGMPFFLLDARKFFNDGLFYNIKGYMSENPNKNTWLFYFTNHLRNGLGIPLLTASLCGAGYAAYKRSKWDMLLLSIPLGHYLVFMHSTGFAYHMLPAIPFMLILAARFLEVIARNLFPKFALAAFTSLCLITVFPTFVDSVKFMKMISSPDTRNMAKSWIEKNIPTGAKVLEEGYVYTIAIHGPALAENMDTLLRDLDYVISRQGSGFAVKTKMANFKRLYGEGRSYDLFKRHALSEDDVRRTDAAYVITTGDNDNPTGPELNYYMKEDYYEGRKKMLDAVYSRYSLIRSFVPSCEMTAWVPHLSDQDYVALRALRWGALKNYVKGPRIDIFRIKE